MEISISLGHHPEVKHDINLHRTRVQSRTGRRLGCSSRLITGKAIVMNVTPSTEEVGLY